MTDTIVTTEPSDLSKFNNNYFNIMHKNIRSIRKNFDELQILMKYLNINLHILILTECWINQKYLNLEIPGYTTYSSLNNIKQNDGVIVYIKNEIKAEVEEIIVANANCLKIKIGKEKVILAVYRSPSTRNIDPFLKSIDEELCLLKDTKNIFFIGDININILENGHPKKIQYLQMLASHGLESLINVPTRKVDDTQSCIDHIMSKTKEITQNVVFNSTITDHYTTMLSIKINKPNKIMERPLTTEKTQTNWNVIKQNLQCTDWNKLQSMDNTNEAWNYFIELIQQNIFSNTVKIVKKISHKNIHIKPWITQNVINCIRKRDELHKKLKNNPYDIHMLRYYKRYRNICKKVITHTKETYYKQKIDDCKQNPRKMWQIINEITSTKSANATSIDELNINNVPRKYAENPDEILEYVNNFFINIGSNLAKQATQCDEAVQTNESPEQGKKLEFKQITADEIKNTISSLKTNVSSGEDLITTNAIKFLCKELIVPLTYLVNMAITESVFPTALKKAIVIPIYKQGCKNDINNYRPISLLNTFSKILERILKKQLLSYLEENNILSETQYGFRENLSTGDAIETITDMIIKSLDRGEKTLAIFIDLQKAFDTIDHKILFAKLSKIGMSNRTLNLLKSYMTERTQSVQINKKKSKPLLINHGVPQGSVLGPILFLIYINDIGSLGTRGKIISFADDTVIVFHEKDWRSTYKEAEHGLGLLQNWLKRNSLTLNVNKTKYLTFSITARGQPEDDFNLKLHTCQDNYQNQGLSCHCPTIAHSKSIKYLGIEIDDNLRWNAHIEVITKKLTRYIYFFRAIRNILNINDIKKVYYAVCQSQIEYGITGWGSALSTHMDRLNIAQKGVLKTILKLPVRTPTEELFQNIQVYNIQKLYAKNILFKIKKNISEYSTVQHRYTTRAINQNILATASLKTSFGQRNMKFNATKLYNALPTQTKKITEINKFKTKVKIWLREQSENELSNILKTM